MNLRFRNGCNNSGKIWWIVEIPFQGGSHARSSHEASLEPTTKRREDLGKHNVHTHFTKDRNCEIYKRTKITRDPCRRRKGEAVPRAANFGDLITADHKVLSDNCESRNNHRFAVVVQDLATQWMQAYPCKNKTSQETQRSLQKFLEPERKPKVIYWMNRDKRLSQSIARKLVITNSKQLMPKKNAEFYAKNFGVSNRIFLKFINKILQR